MTLIERLRFHGRHGSESNDEMNIRKRAEREEAADRLASLEGENERLLKIINDNEYDPLPNAKGLSLLDEAQARLGSLEGALMEIAEGLEDYEESIRERFPDNAALAWRNMAFVQRDIARQALSDPQS